MTLSRLVPFCGVWAGDGDGEYPTIPAFRYRERLTLHHDAERELIRIEIVAWKVVGCELLASHHEVGAIVANGDTLVMSTIQNGTRYERLRGRVTDADGACLVSWHSEAYAADDRMRSSRREMTFGPAELRYQMWMHTTAVPGPVLHLTAVLRRV